MVNVFCLFVFCFKFCKNLSFVVVVVSVCVYVGGGGEGGGVVVFFICFSSTRRGVLWMQKLSSEPRAD